MSPRASSTPALTFLGAAGTVTGSKFLRRDRRRPACWSTRGSTRGSRELRRRNWEPLPGRPASHRRRRADPRPPRPLRLPAAAGARRVRRPGRSAPPSTAALAAIVLRDSAHLQEEDARYAEPGRLVQAPPGAAAVRRRATSSATLPLLAPVDVRRSPRDLAPGVRVTLQPGGPHPRLRDRRASRRADAGCCSAATSGRADHPLLRPPVPTRRPPTRSSSSRPTATAATRAPDPDAARRRDHGGPSAAVGAVLVPGLRGRPHRAGPARAARG